MLRGFGKEPAADGGQLVGVIKRSHEAELTKKRALSAESIPAGIGVFDFRNGVLHLNYLNNGFYQMTGLRKESYVNENNGDALKAVFAEDRPVLLQNLEAAIREKRPLRMNDYITKPIDPQKLYQILNKNIAGSDQA